MNSPAEKQQSTELGQEESMQASKSNVTLAQLYCLRGLLLMVLGQYLLNKLKFFSYRVYTFMFPLSVFSK